MTYSGDPQTGFVGADGAYLSSLCVELFLHLRRIFILFFSFLSFFPFLFTAAFNDLDFASTEEYLAFTNLFRSHVAGVARAIAAVIPREVWI